MDVVKPEAIFELTIDMETGNKFIGNIWKITRNIGVGNWCQES